MASAPEAKPPEGGLKRAGLVATTYAGAFVFGLIGYKLNVPLAWMIGALVFAATMRLSELPLAIPRHTRATGQVLVAASVGLAFTPEAVSAMGSLLVPMLLAALATIAIGFLVAAVLMRLAQVDVITATLASVPMGPVESANLANKHGVLPGPVIFSQTLRIVLLVLLIPPALVAIDGSVSDPHAALRAVNWTPSGALLLCAVALGGAWLFRLVGLSNPFFIGALAGAALASALSLPLTAFPYPVLVLAQIFLGVWLGAVFDRELLRRAGGFIGGAIVAALLMIALCTLMGLTIAWATGHPWQVMVLATAPGSVTEMALTAKILEEGLAVVTAFHLLRIFIILPFAPWIVGLSARIAAMSR
jgi:uncharacterized protein